MAWNRPAFGGGNAPAAPAPQPQSATPDAPPAAHGNPTPSRASGGWDDYVPDDGRTVPDVPPPPDGAGRRGKNGKMGPGKHVAWVDGILRWPRGDSTVLVVTFCSTNYETLGWDQEPSSSLLADNEKAQKALSFWTRDLCELYASLGFPDEAWPRRPAADGSPRRVPPWSHFWHQDARGKRAPVAFELTIANNYKGYPELREIAYMAGPRLAPLPTTLPPDLAARIGWPHAVETFDVMGGQHQVTAAKIPRNTWLQGTDLVTIEDLLPKRRGA